MARKKVRRDEIAAPDAMLLDVSDVARLLRVSQRTVYRLRDGGIMPAPRKVGTALVRWARDDIARWVADGCPNLRTGSGSHHRARRPREVDATGSSCSPRDDMPVDRPLCCDRVPRNSSRVAGGRND